MLQVLKQKIKLFFKLIHGFLKGLIIFTIYLYQKIISPIFPNSCRYYPSCSNYSIQAIKKYGILKGGSKSVLRILRCNPFSSGGYDPV